MAGSTWSGVFSEFEIGLLAFTWKEKCGDGVVGIVYGDV